MKRTVWLWSLFGFAVTALGGTLLHFLYEWLGEARWIAPFSGVNESTWEHMKLFYWPTFIYAIFESFFFKGYSSFWCVKLRTMIIGLSLIPLLFYTYNGVIGKSPDWVNISIFFVSSAVAYIYEARALKGNKAACPSSRLALALLVLTGFLFVIFTFRTPELAIFKDPISGMYGI